MEKLRSEILQQMVGKLSDTQLNDLEQALDIVLHNYVIEEKTTDLAIYDDSNNIVINNFIGSKLVEGCSDKTVRHYKETITRMVQDIGKGIKEISTADIRYHLAKWKIDRGVRNTTLNNMRKAYSSFFSWLLTEEYIVKNPMLRIPAFKIEKKQIAAFTEREFETLCSVCETIRDRALVEFLYSTGCRVSECSAINISDIDFRQGTVRIKHGKGNKERIAYISDKCMVWLEKYLLIRSDDMDVLWLGTRGRLHKSGIEAIVRKLGEKANIKAFPHKYRHTLATDLLRRGAAPQYVQQILGHEDISTTMIYCTIDTAEIENTHRKLIA